MEIQTLNKMTTLKEITNIEIKTRLLTMIYEKLSIASFKYQLLDDITSFEILKKENIYHITPHIMGINCWLIFFENAGKRYQCIIHKKDLKHHMNQLNINNITIYTFWFNHQNAKNISALYPLTIFDGKFIINTQNNLTYNITDMYIYGGNLSLSDNLPNKISKIENILQTIIIPHMIEHNEKKNFDIKIASIYKTEQIGDLIFNKIKASKLKINGLIFLPIKSGKTYIYINDSAFTSLRTQYTETSLDQDIKKCISLSIPAIPLHMSSTNDKFIDKQLVNEFIFKKTNISDVFELYKCINKEHLYLNIDKNNKIGIAYIPDISTSHMCKKLADEKEIFLHKCVFNVKFNKWMPISQDNN